MGNYNIKQQENRYVIYNGEEVVTTPGGNDVTTLYKPLADRIIHDLNEYGYNFHSSSSILAWHFTMIDNFVRLGHDGIVRALSQSFLSHPDWTCVERYSASWQRTFGSWANRADQIAQWFEKATPMQLTAICCIGNAYESVNLALELAKVLEKYSAGKERDSHLDNLAEMISDTMQFGNRADIYHDFKTFELYYGIHLDQEGPILDDIADEIIEDGDEDDLDVDNLTEYSVTVEQLVGRNFYHYTDCEKDEEQPAAFSFSDLTLDESEEDEECDDEDEDIEEDDEDDEFESLRDYLPDDCWVKRFVDDSDPNICYLLYLALNEDGEIQDSGCIEETSQRMGGGGMFFFIPGMELPSIKSYDYCSYPPEKVIQDLRWLFAGRSLPLNFSFRGKRLPQKMIDGGGNGGSITEYTYALQSAYRLAYMHMSIDTTAEGIIENFEYSTYQSSGDACGDMFSRPRGYSDRQDEALDMLLYIFDMYTEDELSDS